MPTIDRVAPLPGLARCLPRRRALQWTLALATPVAAASTLATAARAQTPPAPPPILPILEGQTLEGRPLRLADLRGRVVLVFYWSTACAVCRDKMPELRANLSGWHGRPFTLLGVNMDTRRQDLVDYERFVAQAIPVTQRFHSVWAGAPGFVDSLGRPEHLPSASLIDARGHLVERHVGRIPSEAWDRIADLV